MAPDVADAAEGEHQPGIGQHVADHDPLDHRDRQSEAAGDVRKTTLTAVSSGTTEIPSPTSATRTRCIDGRVSVMAMPRQRCGQTPVAETRTGIQDSIGR